MSHYYNNNNNNNNNKRKLLTSSVSVDIGCSCTKPTKLFRFLRPNIKPKPTSTSASSSSAAASGPLYRHYGSSSSDSTATSYYSLQSLLDAEAAPKAPPKPVKGFGRIDGEGLAVEKDSDDPYLDFRHSMLQMILENGIYSKQDMKELLNCFLQLNSPYYHAVIVRAFTDIWNGVVSPGRSTPPSSSDVGQRYYHQDDDVTNFTTSRHSYYNGDYSYYRPSSWEC